MRKLSLLMVNVLVTPAGIVRILTRYKFPCLSTSCMETFISSLVLQPPAIPKIATTCLIKFKLVLNMFQN